MDRTTDDLNRPPDDAVPGRPRDLALLFLAVGTGPPRARARDQQADVAGGELRRRVLDHVAALDPEPSDLDETLAAVVAEAGDPAGPTRAAASLFRQEWHDALHVPGAWAWLLAEALERSASDPDRREGRRGAP